MLQAYTSAFTIRAIANVILDHFLDGEVARCVLPQPTASCNMHVARSRSTFCRPDIQNVPNIMCLLLVHSSLPGRPSWAHEGKKPWYTLYILWFYSSISWSAAWSIDVFGHLTAIALRAPYNIACILITSTAWSLHGFGNPPKIGLLAVASTTFMYLSTTILTAIHWSQPYYMQRITCLIRYIIHWSMYSARGIAILPTHYNSYYGFGYFVTKLSSQAKK